MHRNIVQWYGHIEWNQRLYSFKRRFDRFGNWFSMICSLIFPGTLQLQGQGIISHPLSILLCLLLLWYYMVAVLELWCHSMIHNLHIVHSHKFLTLDSMPFLRHNRNRIWYSHLCHCQHIGRIFCNYYYLAWNLLYRIYHYLMSLLLSSCLSFLLCSTLNFLLYSTLNFRLCSLLSLFLSYRKIRSTVVIQL